MSCNCNQSVEIGEKLASLWFKLINPAHWLYKSCFFNLLAVPIDHTYSAGHVLLLLRIIVLFDGSCLSTLPKVKVHYLKLYMLTILYYVQSMCSMSSFWLRLEVDMASVFESELGQKGRYDVLKACVG